MERGMSLIVIIVSTLYVWYLNVCGTLFAIWSFVIYGALIFYDKPTVLVTWQNIMVSVLNLLWTTAHPYLSSVIPGKDWRKDHPSSWWYSLYFSWQKLRSSHSSMVPSYALETSHTSLSEAHKRSTGRFDKS